MTIEPGRTLLHYRLVEKIGEGGMGVVWKALDTTLDREVAIKLLPAGFTDDPVRLGRFQREAKLLASLSHPNIAVVHGLHDARPSGGAEVEIRFLAMEFVAGEDLTSRLSRGPLSINDALEHAIRIADALEAAHENGVIHRDLKPANVRLTPDGDLKVLDFGLAKAFEAESSSGSVDTLLSPTLTSVGSVAGIILGTAGYMSPEQARGKPVDRRTDVWAFGCVLYEMLTGKQAFPGETVSDIIAGILAREVDWDALPEETPAKVRLLLRRCLRKDPRRRMRDMGDIALELRELDTTDETEAVASEPPRAMRAWFWPILSGILLVGLLYMLATRGIGTGRDGGDTPAQHVVEMTPITDRAGAQHSPNLAPDGKDLLYVAAEDDDDDIFLQRVGGEKPINLTADSAGDDFDPAFSPDGERIAFCSEREGGGIFVMGATGESPRRISQKGFHPSWSPDGSRLVFTTERVTDPYSRATTASLWTVDLGSLEKRLLHEEDAVAPRYSPNGRRIAFWTAERGQRDIWTIDAEGGDPRPVTQDAQTDWGPIWSPDGRWLYFVSDRGGSSDLWRVPIDENSGQTLGPLDPVTTGVAEVLQASVSTGGRRIAVTVGDDAGEIVRVGFDPAGGRPVGDSVDIVSSSNRFQQFDVSTDGKWLAYRTSGPREHLIVMRADGSGRRQLTDDVYRNRGPRWSPDGRWLAFYSNRGGSYEIWAVRPDGTGLRQLTDEDGKDVNDPTWSPDGRRIAVSLSQAETRATGFLELGDAGLDDVDGLLEIRRPAGSLDFYPDRWSTDGAFIAGAALASTGEWALAIYSVASDSYEMLRGPAGEHMVSFGTSMTWLEDGGLVFWDFETARAWIWDVRNGTGREMHDAPGPAEFRFADGDRTMFVARTRIESDIWLLTLN